jgi:hypothetical protein
MDAPSPVVPVSGWIIELSLELSVEPSAEPSIEASAPPLGEGDEEFPEQASPREIAMTATPAEHAKKDKGRIASNRTHLRA